MRPTTTRGETERLFDADRKKVQTRRVGLIASPLSSSRKEQSTAQADGHQWLWPSPKRSFVIHSSACLTDCLACWLNRLADETYFTSAQTDDRLG